MNNRRSFLNQFLKGVVGLSVAPQIVTHGLGLRVKKKNNLWYCFIETTPPRPNPSWYVWDELITQQVNIQLLLRGPFNGRAKIFAGLLNLDSSSEPLIYQPPQPPVSS